MKRLTVRDEETGEAYFPKCFEECGGYCKECKYETDYCETLASYEDTGLTPDQVKKLSGNLEHWKEEATLQTAAAGEISMELQKRLDQIRQQEEKLREQLTGDMPDMEHVIITWKLQQYAEQKKWIKAMLRGGKRKC